MITVATQIEAGIRALQTLETQIFPVVGYIVLSNHADRALSYQEVAEMAEEASCIVLESSLGEAVAGALRDAGLGALAVPADWNHDGLVKVFLARLCETLAKWRLPSLACPYRAAVDIVELRKREREELLCICRSADETIDELNEDIERPFFRFCNSLPAKLGLVPYRDGLYREPFADERMIAGEKLSELLLKEFDAWARRVGYLVVDGTDVVPLRRTLGLVCQINAMADRVIHRIPLA